MTGVFVATTKVYLPRSFKVRICTTASTNVKLKLCKGPVARFGDTAANAGILALLQSNPYLSKLPSPIKTIFASLW